ncbi:MAG: hypothetical protein WD845_04870 [Pirellulales bacterium]
MRVFRRPAIYLLTASMVLAELVGPLAGEDKIQSFSLADLPAAAQPLKFDLNGIAPPAGGHLQGIQMRFDSVTGRHLAFLSHDSLTVAFLLVVEFPGDLSQPGRAIHLHVFPSDGQSPPLRHAGGIQLCENVLAVGVEDNQQKTRSQVQFWDVSNPLAPRQREHLAIHRSGNPEDQTAGGVALARRKGDHVAAVANWDSRAIDFYVSNGKPLDDRACRFAMIARWTAAAADKSDWQPDSRCEPYQAVNLVATSDGVLRLVGFASTPSGQDVADVFAVDLDQRDTGRLLRKQARKIVTLTAGNHFRYAGGLWLDGNRPGVLSSQRNLAPPATLNLLR